MRVRVATYNVHRCQGLDGRVKPDRIAAVIAATGADIVGLQEVWSVPGGAAHHDQAHYLAGALGFHAAVGTNRRFRRGVYGNVILSRFPVSAACNYDLSLRGREERGCLRADVCGPDGLRLHVFNVHLGTAFLERREQGRRLIASDVLCSPGLAAPRVLLGDFNEWTRGLASQLVARCLQRADPRRGTYPGLLPLLHLDHIYYDSSLRLVGMGLERGKLALAASDHLPLWADLEVTAG